MYVKCIDFCRSMLKCNVKKEHAFFFTLHFKTAGSISSMLRLHHLLHNQPGFSERPPYPLTDQGPPESLPRGATSRQWQGLTNFYLWMDSQYEHFLILFSKIFFFSPALLKLVG